MEYTFDYDGFIGELEQSRLVLDVPSDVIDPVECYESTLSTVLDKFAPQRQIRVTARSSAPWFDADCRHCKASTRKLEKAYWKKPCDQSRSAWQRQFSSQRELFQQKLVAYWTATVDACGSKGLVVDDRCYSHNLTAILSYLPTTSHTTLRRRSTVSVR